jgi:hypothetical protein
VSEFSFVGTWADSWIVLSAILDRGDIAIIPDLKYEKPEPIFVSVMDQALQQMVKERRRVFLWCRAFSIFPPYMLRIDGGPNAGKYSVYLPEGGPVLELTLPACYESEGIANLAPGTLSFPRRTLNPETGRWGKASSELLEGFKDIRDRIKRCLVRSKSVAGIWIGPDAERLVDKKMARIHGFEGRKTGGVS